MNIPVGRVLGLGRLAPITEAMNCALEHTNETK